MGGTSSSVVSVISSEMSVGIGSRIVCLSETGSYSSLVKSIGSFVPINSGFYSKNKHMIYRSIKANT